MVSWFTSKLKKNGINLKILYVVVEIINWNIKVVLLLFFFLICYIDIL